VTAKAEPEKAAAKDAADHDQESFAFLKGGDNFFAAKEGVATDFLKSSELVREQLSEAMNSRNVAFLLGAGCSSLISNGKQVGVATMPSLAKEFANTVGQDNDEIFPTAAERKDLKDKVGLDIAASEFAQNLERLMECSYAYFMRGPLDE
jgi:hypothetical protein